MLTTLVYVNNKIWVVPTDLVTKPFLSATQRINEVTIGQPEVLDQEESDSLNAVISNPDVYILE